MHMKNFHFPKLLFVCVLLRLWQCKPESSQSSLVDEIKSSEAFLAAKSSILSASYRTDRSEVAPLDLFEFMKQNHYDSSMVVSLRSESERVHNAIVALRPSGIRVFLEDGSYNPSFVDSVTHIINASSLPREIKADKIRRSFSLRQPEKYSANPEYQKLVEKYPIIKEDEKIQQELIREILNK